MDVAGLLLSAIAFVDSAAKTGSVLARLFKDCGEAGKQVFNATQRLEAQKYTLELWQGIWRSKAQKRGHPTLENGFRDLWGEEGHEIILKCLAQLNVKFGEAFRTLRSIDPDSFATSTSKTALADDIPQAGSSQSSRTAAGEGSRSPSPSGSGEASSKSTLGLDDAGDESRKKHWFHRLSGSSTKSIWRRKKLASTSLIPTDLSTPEEQAELAQQALQHKMSPGTKFKWSMSQKEQIRSLVNDIDDWLALLQTLASRCEAERNDNKASNVNNPSSIRAAAKALYTALRNNPSSHDLQFKLEKERTDSSYFEQVVGPVEYVDQTDKSFKFPLLISTGHGGDAPFLLLAEAIYPSTMATPLLATDKETPLDEIVKSLKNQTSKNISTATSVLSRSPQTMIIIHALTNGPPASPIVSEAFLKCSFAELLRAESGVDPLVALWKRLQLACIIAISVLHLYETGWISEHLETNDFHFFGSADSQYHERTRIAPYVSAAERPKAESKKTPFDVLQRNPIPPSLLGSRDERLATLFHRLGIVLFELGRGVQHRELFGEGRGSESEVVSEIEKIPFGRPYRDLVKTCLTGSLYATSAIHIDSQFDRAVVEKLIRLEQHFSAILHGDM